MTSRTALKNLLFIQSNMPYLWNLRKDLFTYLKEHGLLKKWEKIKKLFEENPRHPSLHTELLEPKDNLIYSFRLDRKYRALFIIHQDKSAEIIAFTKHYR